MNTNSENIEDIRRMQQEAVKRVQEMQKKAKFSLEYSNPGNSSSVSKESGIRSSFSNQSNGLYIKQNQRKTMLGIEELTKDPEKSLILVLILLLADENVDIVLILALFYIFF